ncbi:hypothetical protein CSUB_C0751 [Candidatus Caldarchaeum subterraneum]|uniref:Uncharacterized protein n=1 Tax=Caldiarchaeum subterraneum TaxID=311458 RepID=E6N611_CALS0|nr:hypothetical protein HGMM_F13A09C13 [Candidatus Caldarchaeum subterraneum]BAJ49437.1 hypothetical protein HGMM_F15D08C28 [Candidatus Caldarchaeum subterraneum]BAJ50609.1 hypothetical protein CSUB_C0751 [Candidatus Caldarchaeum subterraneum]
MNEMQENTPWITEYIKHLVEKYFGPCGLVEDALKELRNLPKNLSKRLGCDEHFWQQYLSDPNNASQKLNAIEGAVNYVGERAHSLSEQHDKDLCYYLNLTLDKQEMTNWLLDYTENFLIPVEKYKNRRVCEE